MHSQAHAHDLLRKRDTPEYLPHLNQEIIHYLLLRHSGCHPTQYIIHGYSQISDTRLPASFILIDRYDSLVRHST